MIFTLIGADFSKSNIGTLSSWIISCKLGAGTTYTGPSFVEKNTTFSATVTLDEGYEIGSAGITITMGGTALDESYYSVVDNVITINIAEVTGNVVIKVPTKSVVDEPEIPETPTNYTFTIEPDPSTATVTLSATGYSTVTGTGITTIEVADGTSVTYTVVANGYNVATGNNDVTGDVTLPVTLTENANMVALTLSADSKDWSNTAANANKGIEGYNIKYNTSLTDMKNKPADGNTVADVVVIGYPLDTYNNVYNGAEAIGINATGVITLRNNDYAAAGRVEYATWLATNPITIVYEKTNG